jgi:SAM-dependent MidA family methyltransferase
VAEQAVHGRLSVGFYNAKMKSNSSVSGHSPGALHEQIKHTIATHGGWISFAQFMAMALYEPGLGYYANGSRKFGALPQSGSDFTTAPELSPLFGWALSRQVAQALRASDSTEIWEFGAGTGALAEQLLQGLAEQGQHVSRYTIVDLSLSLQARQRQRLAPFGDTVQWVSSLPAALHGVAVGNEVLDAMPVQLLFFDGAQWFERGVVVHTEQLAWGDIPTTLRPPCPGPYLPGTTLEIHSQAHAFVSTLAQHLTRGAAFFIDYGFPQTEYYHPQRVGGTLMCHRAHMADTNPLQDVGLKDITSHVNFTGVAMAAQDAGLQVLGYTSQAHFLINCGLVHKLENTDVRVYAPALKLLQEHEMGELFKVIGLAKNCQAEFTTDPLGFAQGDRSHRL